MLTLLLVCGGRTAACAQVAVADSLVTDSLVNDSLTMLQDRQLEILEAPIDTARLYAGSDSIHQTTTPEPVKKRWMPDPKRATWLCSSREEDRFIIASIGNYRLSMADLWDVPTP